MKAGFHHGDAEDAEKGEEKGVGGDGDWRFAILDWGLTDGRELRGDQPQRHRGHGEEVAKARASTVIRKAGGQGGAGSGTAGQASRGTAGGGELLFSPLLPLSVSPVPCAALRAASFRGSRQGAKTQRSAVGHGSQVWALPRRWRRAGGERQNASFKLQAETSRGSSLYSRCLCGELFLRSSRCLCGGIFRPFAGHGDPAYMGD